MRGACRSCPAEVVWCETVTGKRMPVDAAPVDQALHADARGLFVIDPPLPTVSGVVPKALAVNALDPELHLHTSHFATCPYANAYRKPRTAGARP